MTTILLESCRVAPPPGAAPEQSVVPLTFLDITWLFFHPICQILFYELPDCSKPYFMHEIVPKVKESLSLTLKHYFPLAGNILYPLKPDRMPELYYRTGDSVSVTFFESSDDFDNLVGNHARDADNFYDFVPLLSQTTDEEADRKLLEVVAVQVTLFSGRGVCIGFSNHHGVGDASSINGFIKYWALINKQEGLISISDNEIKFLPPVFDRSLIKYHPELDSVVLNQIRRRPLSLPCFPLPTNRVRATYVLTESEIKKLKNLVLEKIPGLGHVSSFVVMTAYVWNCLAKSLIAGDEEKVVVDDDEPEFFLFPVDARARIDPPVPGNYFGNCLSFGLPKISHQELVGEEGFFTAAEAIAGEIKNRVVNNNNILGGAENWSAEVGFAFQNRVLAVSGSAKVDLYSADFGWGKAKKVEALSIDPERYAMSLCKSRDCEGGLEIGLSLSKGIMDAFSAIYSDGIRGE